MTILPLASLLRRASSSFTSLIRWKGRALCDSLAAVRNPAKGCSGDLAPEATPISRMIPNTSIMMPIPFHNLAHLLALTGRLSSACRYTAGTISKAAQSANCSAVGITGEISQTAIARSMTPKKLRMAFIQGPVLGSKVPAEAPSKSNGTPIPIDNANSAAPPKMISPDWLI
jgi:hypothetical protein